jgi:hypothetical protein
MKKTALILILIVINCHNVLSQIPHLKGEVKISILNGTIESDLEYSNLPKLTNYSIWLNTGLNVRYFRNADDNYNYFFDKYYDDNKIDEAFQYYFPTKDKKVRFLPNDFKINYSGKFPVISDTLRASDRGDNKGINAFNGKSLRATEQSVWYPILYDIDNDVALDKVTYDITIKCEDCKTIYLNGSAPVNGTSANFKSDKAVSLMLFAGLFDFNKNKNTYFINTDLNTEQENEFGSWTDKIVGFYEKKLKMNYGSPVTFIYSTPITKNSGWMFVTYPSIAIIQSEKYNMKTFFDESTNKIKNISMMEYISHELGHYYFGTVFCPNSDLRPFFSEGLTEYLALQTTKEVIGEENYKKKIESYLKRTKDFTPKPLSIVKVNEVDNTYRYDYAPLLITALEKEVGKEKVWNWLRTILNSDKQVKSDYEFFKSTLLKSGITEKEFKSFEDKYILSENAKENVYNSVK